MTPEGQAPIIPLAILGILCNKYVYILYTSYPRWKSPSNHRPLRLNHHFWGQKNQTTAIRGQRTWSPPPRCRLRRWHWYRRRTKILRPWGRASRSRRRRWRRKRQRVAGGRWQEKCWEMQGIWWDCLVFLTINHLSFIWFRSTQLCFLANESYRCLLPKLGNTLNVQTLLAIS